MARWSSGQDGGLSRRKREFDSPTGHHVGMDYIPFKKPSHLAGLFSYHFVIPPFPHKTLQGKFLRGPRCREEDELFFISFVVQFSGYFPDITGVNGGEVPPVPIPNTEVKLCCAEDTWLETTWENR